ncbi:Helicase associated domain protein [Planoprotostelium fungivorum]|uniref:Helicase associated domain protein n=1 Tax=Planoprotostelium fungivorum TaxID=1890364 RepID=A0A2P6NZM8_9EUKA|nr:Helicase associated domain protein [Planoprotostelium fungivorum]
MDSLNLKKRWLTDLKQETGKKDEVPQEEKRESFSRPSDKTLRDESPTNGASSPNLSSGEETSLVDEDQMDNLGKRSRDKTETGDSKMKRMKSEESERLKQLEHQLSGVRKRIESEKTKRNHLEQVITSINHFTNIYIHGMAPTELIIMRKVIVQEVPMRPIVQVKSSANDSDEEGDDDEQEDSRSDSDDEYWMECFSGVSAFVKSNGDFPAYEDNSDLFRWLNDQVKRNNRGTIKQDQLQMLSDLGFNFKIRRAPKAEWDRLFEMLETLKRETGSCEVPRTKKYQSLFTWATEQRKNSRYGRLSQQRIEQLNGIGFNWEEDSWRPHIARELRETPREPVVREKKKEEPVSNGQESSGDNSPSYVDGNDNGGSESDSDSESKESPKSRGANFRRKSKTEQYDLWTERYKQLKEFQQENGHCKPSSGANKSLGVWVATMRNKKKKGKLTEEQIRKLERIGFEWNAARR